MGGFIAVEATFDAARRAQAGACAMHRGTEQPIAIHDAGAVALAFCGVHGGLIVDGAAGVAVALDGELVVGARTLTGSEAAKHLLDLYDRDGETLAAPDGQFGAVIWDPRSQSLVLLTDMLGTRPVYTVRVGATTIVATELKAIIAAGVAPALDPQGWAEILSYEHTLGDRTPLAGVRRVPAATTLVIGADGSRRALGRGTYRIDPAPDGDVRELVEEYGRLLAAAVRRRSDSATGLALSGGLDSRCLAAVAAAEELDLPAFTFGAAGSEELRRARPVARILDLDHTVVELQPGYIARGAAEVVWLTEGRIRCFHAHHLVLRELGWLHELDAVLIGYAGDGVVRWGAMTVADEFGFAERDVGLVEAVHGQSCIALRDSDLDVVLQSRFAATLRGLAHAGTAEALAQEVGPPDVRRLQFAIHHVYPHKIIPGAELFRDALAPRDPYIDAELLGFLARIPRNVRRGGELQRAYLRRIPELARVPNPKDGVRPAVTGTRHAVALHAVRTRRGVASRLEGIRRRTGRPPRRGLGDYGADLRHPGGQELLGVLLEPRTLARAQLREPAVRRMVAETLRGGRSHTRMLGVLLTLELFQRQFVEGDSPLRVFEASDAPVASPP